MSEIQLVIQGRKTHHKMSLRAQRLLVYCVQVWLGLLLTGYLVLHSSIHLLQLFVMLKME